MTLAFYKIHESAQLPTYGTEHSACFDFYASLPEGQEVIVYDKYNQKEVKTLYKTSIALNSGERALIPTNLIADIPNGHVLKVYPRSGHSLKQGLTLANCTGIIDADYVEPLFIMLTNISAITVVIKNGDRVAQGELCKYDKQHICEIWGPPTRKSDRNGGLGSTGV